VFNQAVTHNSSITANAGLYISSGSLGYVQISDKYIVVYGSSGVHIQNAVNALSATGGTIELLNATYYINTPISISKNGVYLKGNGHGTVLYSQAYALWSSITNMITLNSVIGFTMDNLMMNGNPANTGQTVALIRANTSKNVNINNCVFLFSDWVGVFIGNCNYVNITGCYLRGDDEYGIYLGGLGDAYSIIGNTFDTEPSEALEINASLNTVVQGNQFISYNQSLICYDF